MDTRTVEKYGEAVKGLDVEPWALPAGLELPDGNVHRGCGCTDCRAAFDVWRRGQDRAS